MSAATTPESKPVRHRPKSYTVFAAAFLAGAAAAVGVNRVLDVHLAQRRPQVECEPIFVALRGMPQGAPVTVWDVALKDWPKAMLPATALRAGDAFEGYVLRHAIREGQPLLTVQLVRSGSDAEATGTAEAFIPAVPAATTATTTTTTTETSADLWTPAAAPTAEPVAKAAPPAAVVVTTQPTVTATAPTVTETVPTVAASTPKQAEQPAAAETVAVPATEIAATVPPTVPSTDEPVAEPATVAIAEPVVPPTEAPVAPSPAALPTPAAAAPATQPTPTASALADESETSEAVATDVSAIPSVMKQPTTASQPAAAPTAGDAGRYLVVPERIAMQADTSFTTPRPQPPGPPATARPTTQPKPRSASGSTGKADTRRGGQPTAAPQRQAQATSATTRPTPPQATQRGEQPSATRKPWGGMFPNVAAGIDAIGGQWQRSRSTAGQPQRGDQPVSR
jgi:hypothetical protein